MFPTPDAGVARRFIDLINRLQPRAFGIGGGELATLPTIATAILDDVRRLVLPVLAPMFGHHGLADRAVLLHDAHLEDVHQADVLAVVAIDVNFSVPHD